MRSSRSAIEDRMECVASVEPSSMTMRRQSVIVWCWILSIADRIVDAAFRAGITTSTLRGKLI